MDEFIVIARHYTYLSIQTMQYFNRFILFHRIKEVAQVKHRVTLSDTRIPSFDEPLIHLRYIRKRSRTVADNIGMPEVGIRREEYCHVRFFALYRKGTDRTISYLLNLVMLIDVLEIQQMQNQRLVSVELFLKVLRLF